MIKRTTKEGVSILHKIVVYICLLFFIIVVFAVLFSMVVGVSVGFLLKMPYSAIAFPGAYYEDSDMRELGLIMAKDCASDQDCVIIKVYNNLSQELSYSHTPYNKYMDKRIVWEQRSGDCKSVSGLYTNILINMGVMSYISVSINGKHSVSVAEPKDEDYYYMIDLTVPMIERYDKGVDFWKFYHFK